MVNKKGTIAALAAGAAAAATTVAALRRTHRLQAEARAAGTHVPRGPYEAVVKRPLDAIIAAGGLVVLSPVMAATALAVRQKLGSPIIFKQQRPGLNGKPFEIYKFRTMTDERDPETGALLPDDVRLTAFGKLLRATSIDELPELVSVVKGDMALIGPRPLLMRYLEYYSAEERQRHDVRPGLTGLAQVHGRNYSSWEARFEYDLAYVNRITFLGDAKIILDSIKIVLSHAGVADRSQIHADEDGNLYIVINGVRHKYPKPLDEERKVS